MHLGREEQQGYGQPYAQSKLSYADDDTGYVWGSNSFVADNAVILAAAYDLTGEQNYLNGVISAMDYLLGRNPMDVSYITGYGSHAVQYPHHRYWAHQISEEYPMAPAGVLVGGPNSGMQDPWVQGSGWKKGEIAPAKCYLDNIEAWSVNECTINWNAPLAWLTAFVCDANGGIVANTGSMASEQLDPSAGDSEESSQTSAGSNQQNQANDSTEKSSSGAFPWTLVIVLGAILLGAIVVEVFIYKIVKLKKN